MTHSENLAIKLQAGGEIVHDDGKVIDIETNGLLVRESIIADRQEVGAVLTGFKRTAVDTKCCQHEAAGKEAKGNHCDDVMPWS